MTAVILAVVLTYSQAERLWIDAGGARWLAPTMAAIAVAESRLHFGEANYDRHELGGSFCGWQINLIHTTERGGPFDKGRLTRDPRYCARAAVRVQQKQGLRAWTTYREGTFLSFLRREAPAPHATIRPRVTPAQFLAYAHRSHHLPPKNWTPNAQRPARHVQPPKPDHFNDVQIVLCGLVAVAFASGSMRLTLMTIRYSDDAEDAYRRRTRRRAWEGRQLRHREAA